MTETPRNNPPDNPPDNRPGEPGASSAPGKTVTKAFTLTPDDVAVIEAVRREEGLLSDSAALRLLIRDGARAARRNSSPSQHGMGEPALEG